MYIRGTGNISAQQTFGKVPFLPVITASTGTRLNAVEPDYKDIIDPKMIRRMSRIIRMGVAAAAECLKDAAVEVPGAILTGTAYGCLQDTDIFLSKMVQQQEALLTPTAFIQSTHNTIGAQIGLMLKSNNYNNAFVHRGFSFESALLDGMMLLMENAAPHVLVGAIDEITDNSHAILKRFGLYKQEPVSNINLYEKISRGTIAGEGATFFLLANESSANDYAKLDAFTTFYKPLTPAEIEKQVSLFLTSNHIDTSEVDILVTGKNGDTANDLVYTNLQKTLLKGIPAVNYKNLCGEYPTAVAFAVWLAASMIKLNTIPGAMKLENKNSSKKINKILIYNHYQHTHHSLLLLSAC